MEVEIEVTARISTTDIEENFSISEIIDAYGSDDILAEFSIDDLIEELSTRGLSERQLQDLADSHILYTQGEVDADKEELQNEILDLRQQLLEYEEGMV